jgi:hypothetical protein
VLWLQAAVPSTCRSDDEIQVRLGLDWDNVERDQDGIGISRSRGG